MESWLIKVDKRMIFPALGVGICRGSGGYRGESCEDRVPIPHPTLPKAEPKEVRFQDAAMSSWSLISKKMNHYIILNHWRATVCEPVDL